MVWYLNLIRGRGLRVGKRPTKYTLGRVADVPKFVIPWNVNVYVIDYFVAKGMIVWGQTDCFGKEGWMLTEKGFAKVREGLK